MEICKICGKETHKVFNAKILYKYDVDYFQCSNCEFVQTEKEYWLEEAYQNSMNLTDTGIMHRNQRFSKITASIIILFFDKKLKFLDYAGGYGVFTRIMRDMGFDFYWNDPYTTNALARGFEQEEGIKYHAVTTFESFEHFVDPIKEVEKILELTDNIIFSTALTPKPLPQIDKWWYYGAEHGQHVALYSKKALDTLAKKFDMHYYNLDNMHIFSKKKINPLGALVLKFKYSKYLLYASYFLFYPFLKSRTADDMNSLKHSSSQLSN